jgi:hypothetical protein
VIEALCDGAAVVLGVVFLFYIIIPHEFFIR